MSLNYFEPKFSTLNYSVDRDVLNILQFVERFQAVGGVVHEAFLAELVLPFAEILGGLVLGIRKHLLDPIVRRTRRVPLVVGLIAGLVLRKIVAQRVVRRL